MTWKDILKFNKKSLADIAGGMDSLMWQGTQTNFRRAYESGNYGNEDASKQALSEILDELIDRPDINTNKAKKLKVLMDAMGF